MLTNTFCHIPTVGPGTERKLWTAGVKSWDAFAAADDVPLSAAKREIVRRHLDESARHLERDDPDYFTAGLPAREHWRLFPHFRHRIAYLDIETTGLGLPGDYITSIALYDGETVRTFVKGENLDEFPDAVAPYRLIVTYNGKSFDVPFIRRYMRLPMRQSHIDLMHVLRSLGYRGGLKGCEHQLGLDRGDLEGVDGAFAVLLWHDYMENGNERALETMLAYNVQDVVNLETLLVKAYNLKLKETPFARTHALEEPEAPELPFQADLATVERLKREHPHHGWWG
ncbi:MAG TPA: ribonuclease H-like domain-containing protein [Planctomycetota bacterium]|nr:ribonuclease H-like domain-containing protein [Planctomycetota bacterium]